MASVAEALFAIEGGADAVGLVAAMPWGSGMIADARIAEIAAMVPPPIASFLLTSEITAVHISAHVRATRPTAVQIVSHIDQPRRRASRSKAGVLAGRLTPANAAADIRKVRPFGVDLCTGVRTRGLLDRAKLVSFIRAVQTANEESWTAVAR